MLLLPGSRCEILAAIVAILTPGVVNADETHPPADKALSAIERIELTDENFDLWRDHLTPMPDELRWQDIPWRPTFSDGLVQADAQRRPLLLWVMNGHPLGCT